MDKFVVVFSNGSKIFIKADKLISNTDTIEFFGHDEDGNDILVGRFYKISIAGFCKFKNLANEWDDDMAEED